LCFQCRTPEAKPESFHLHKLNMRASETWE